MRLRSAYIVERDALTSSGPLTEFFFLLLLNGGTSEGAETAREENLEL